MNIISRGRILLLGMAISVSGSLFAKIVPGTPFADHAVLQRGVKVPVWGSATPGNTVKVAFAGQQVAGKVAENGKWRLYLEPMTASAEGRTMTMVEIDQNGAELPGKIKVSDILVGEVWLASGQSNMDCPVWGDNPRFRDSEGALVVAGTFLPNIRYVSVPRVWSVEPKAYQAKWKRFIPSDILSGPPLSAIAFYFSRELHLALSVPVGIVSVAWGGTNIDAWTPRSVYEKDCPEALKEVAAYQVRKDWKGNRDQTPVINSPQDQPTVLWNGMVDTWAPMAVKGMLWYQGCSNKAEPGLYCEKMHALYKGWSTHFGNPGLKLYFVQLAPYASNWMEMVAAQNKFAAEEKNAAIAVAADLGNFYDIHPNKKRTVAQRLLIHALKNDYGFDIKRSDSPVFKEVSFEGGKATLKFDNVSSWYVYADNRSVQPPFEMAGTNGVWQAARLTNVEGSGKVKGNELKLESKLVPDPVKVRYMGRNRTMGTLYNELSLPLGPFESK